MLDGFDSRMLARSLTQWRLVKLPVPGLGLSQIGLWCLELFSTVRFITCDVETAGSAGTELKVRFIGIKSGKDRRYGSERQGRERYGLAGRCVNTFWMKMSEELELTFLQVGRSLDRVRHSRGDVRELGIFVRRVRLDRVGGEALGI